MRKPIWDPTPRQRRMAESYLGGCKPKDLMKATELLRRWRKTTAPAAGDAVWVDDGAVAVEIPVELVPLVPEETEGG